MDWIFQYRPNQYDLPAKVRHRLTDWWPIKRLAREISVGDRVFFLRAGDAAAVTAVGEITAAPYARVTNRGNTVADFVMRSFVIPELSRFEMAQDPVVSTQYVLSNGMQGTNFRLTAEHAAALQTLLAGRLHAAKAGMLSDSVRPLKRSETALGAGQDSIKVSHGRVVAVQVQFTSDPGQERAYSDERLENGEIDLIGRGKRQQGDQKPTHGNVALLSAIQAQDRWPFSVYERTRRGSYVYLGEFEAVGSTHEELDPNFPGYRVYRFRLAPSSSSTQPVATEQNTTVDFAHDVADDLPPDKKHFVRAIIARNRARADEVKEKAGYRCERCSSTTSWRTKKDVPYVEVHHIIPLGDDGFDNTRNMIALCSDCHRYLHVGRDHAVATSLLRSERGI